MSRKTKLIGVYFLILIAILLVYSAFNPAKEDYHDERKEWNIAVLLRTDESDYWNYIRRGADAAAQEFHAKLQLNFPSDEGDVEGQVRIAMSMLDTNPDAIVIGANDNEAFADVLAEANRRHIPVIAIDSKLTSGKTESYIGSDNIKEGKMAVDQMAINLSTYGNILLVSYQNGGINGKYREAGVHEQLNSYANIKLVEHIVCPVDPNECKDLIKKAIWNHEVDGILTLNNKSSIGAALALKEIEASKRISVVGFDSSLQLLDLMQGGHIDTLFVQNPFTIGYLGVQQAVLAAQGKTINRDELSMTLIDKDNMFWLKNQKLLFPIVQ